jgi:hypothetical protein
VKGEWQLADLRVEDAALAHAQTAFRTAGNRPGPIVWALKGLDSGVVGATPLAGKLQEADALLAAELGITGQALTELAARADEIGTVFGGVDQALAQRARAAP